MQKPRGSRAPPDNYRSLDAWRAIAALMVVAFHCSMRILAPEMGWWARGLLGGWIGVFVFFPISGYCILAAV
jgi:peptidoglycan/LPS O-acetylase OafA/YrhL